jgi:hypothetical protein
MLGFPPKRHLGVWALGLVGEGAASLPGVPAERIVHVRRPPLTAPRSVQRLHRAFAAVGDGHLRCLHARLLERLERAYETRSANLCLVGISPWFRGLVGNPRFDELLHRMGLL